MIVYQNTIDKFVKDLVDNQIDKIIENAVNERLGHRVSKQEITSWYNSISMIGVQFYSINIPNDAKISIEYRIPSTSKRIDFIITGEDETHNETVLVIELKQWQNAKLTEKDGIVRTRFKHGESETPHPSYQAWSYCSLLRNFNETVYQEDIQLKPCAYLHNYEEDHVIKNDFYQFYLEQAPVFLKTDSAQLRSFIEKYIKYGDKKDTMYRIESGKIRPSKSLADSVAKMMKGNSEFVLIDDQKIVFENISFMAERQEKKVIIVEGGPGTGKSVVAINLLASLIQKGLNCKYVSKNSAPRAVFESKLTGVYKKNDLSNLFSGSGAFIDSQVDDFDVLIVDEAHRLNEKSGLYKNLGENQIKEIIEAAKVSVFFIDEDQRVTFSDIGKKQDLISWAQKLNAQVHQYELNSQFRCNGSDGYLAWLDNILQIRETANYSLFDLEYDFRIMNSPNELRDLIFEKNKINNKARLVAGYCWDWISKKNPKLMDIVIPEHNFEMKWNLSSYGSLWIVSPESVNEIGCIHTCQGLELDYIGVIIGNDLVIRGGQLITNPKKRAKTDTSLKGYKKLLKTDPDSAMKKADLIIKNTYRTLLTRGMKGCYVYFTDKETEEYFKQMLNI
jgi:DUF2075 family protein